ncbi:MAG: sigma-70 family RNA polymerase sigma factor [Prevotella sp.]|nr:sigma-70 family RNA polymerase sigma factor [Prevotella sp.]
MIDLHVMSDEELALLYVSGDNRAFDLLLSRNQAKLFSYILFVVRDHDLAEDLFQETFVKVITKLQQGRYVNSGKFAAWIMRIAHNVIMDWYRLQRTEKTVEPTPDNDLSSLSDNSDYELAAEMRFVNEQVLLDVKRLMNKLPPTQREVVYMRFFQEMSFKEIADATNVSINTSLGRMRYAILNLRKMVRKNDVCLELV